jgi:hypothetical protein
MTRRLIVCILGAGALLLWAAPAQAKGPFFHDSLSATVKVEGPKMRIPLVLGWKGDCGLFSPCNDIRDLDSDFLAFAKDMMLGTAIPSYSRTYYPVPTEAQLGPAYRVHWTILTEHGQREDIDQLLYPFAQGRPWVFTPAGQGLPEVELSSDPVSAPPSTLGLLQSYGFPTRAAVMGVATGASATAAASGASSARPWVWLLAIGAMTLLLIGGAIAGRRRGTIRAG